MQHKDRGAYVYVSVYVCVCVCVCVCVRIYKMYFHSDAKLDLLVFFFSSNCKKKNVRTLVYGQFNRDNETY